MKKVMWVLVVGLLAIGGSVQANDSTLWHPGELVLNNGIEVSGELNFNWKAEVVQCRQGTIIKAYSANQVYTFRYYDDQQSVIRRFVTIDYLGKAGRRHPRILEEVVSGSLRVYRELRFVPEFVKVVSLKNYGMDDGLVNDIDNFSYLVMADEEMVPLPVFYRTRWPRLQAAFEVDLKRYARNSQADTAHTLGQLRLISLYNSLVEKTANSFSAGSATLSAGH